MELGPWGLLQLQVVAKILLSILFAHEVVYIFLLRMMQKLV
jgi:hypothetical protein